MILKKININGEDRFVSLTIEEAKKAYYNDEELTFTDEEEEANFYDEMDAENVVEEDEEVEDKVVYTSGEKLSLDDKVNIFSSKVEDIVNNTFETVSKNVKNFFNNPKKVKTNKIVSLLPFMEEEDIHNLVNDILEDEESVKDIDLIPILPFLSSEDCDLIFLKALDNSNKKINVVKVAPYVSEECLDRAIDKYINGELEIANIDELYPFLSSKSIKKVFQHILKK